MNHWLAQYDWLHALAGLGLFLFGMAQVEAALEQLAGRRFKRFLREHTNNWLESIASGTIVTAILQSSSVVSLMVLAFVGAGVLDLRNAIGIILGANLGTTVTGWLVTLVGFKVDIAEYAFYLTGAGALAFFFGSAGHKTKKSGLLLVGFGLLFMGLTAMKDAAELLSRSADIGAIVNYPAMVFFPISVCLTALIQSSSAMVVVTLSALAANALTLEQAFLVVIGADLGTTVTVLLGAIKGSADKKRVAAAHLVVNIITVVLAIVLLKPLSAAIVHIFGITDPLLQLVAFHSAFNFVGVVAFLPLLGLFTAWLGRHFSQQANIQALHISKVPVVVADTALAALNQEAQAFWLQVRQLNFAALPWDASGRTVVNLQVNAQDYNEAYRMVKQWEGEIIDYALKLQQRELDHGERTLLLQLLTSVRSAAHAAKCLKDIKSDFDQLALQDNLVFRNLLKEYGETYVAFDARLFAATQQPGVEERFSQLVILLTHNQGQYDRLTQLIYDLARCGELAQAELSTMLNITRELYSAQKSLLLAAKDAFLPSAQAEAIVNVPLVHRPL